MTIGRKNVDIKSLRVLVDLRDRAIQKGRVAMGNRVNAIERGADTSDEETEALLREWHERFEKLELDIDRDIRQLAARYPIIEAATAVKGCGLLNVAKVVALAESIDDKDTISRFWRFAGLGMGEYYIDNETGKIMDPVKGRKYDKTKGEKGEWVVVYPNQPPNSHVEFRPDVPLEGYGLPFNRRLKTSCYLVADRLMQATGPYYELYLTSREKYDREHPEWTKAHRKRAAMRKMIKVWLSHLWEVWRELEGLPTRKAYVIEHLGHTNEHERSDYGWEPSTS